MNKSIKTIVVLLAGMFSIKLFDMMFSPNHIFAGRTADFSWGELLVVAILGLLAVGISNKTAIPEMWDEKISNKVRIYQAYLIGIILGAFFVIFDIFFRIGDISVGWPLSVLFYLWGGISQEIIMHYFPMSLLLWIFGYKIFKGKYVDPIYWIIAVVLSLVSASSMVAAFGNPQIPLIARYAFVPAVVGVLVWGSEMILFTMMKRYGFISSLLTRFGFYTIWHIIWPLVFYY